MDFKCKFSLSIFLFNLLLVSCLYSLYFETPRGHKLRYEHFSCGKPKGAILFIQGRGTFLEFYEPLIQPLLERGFDVWMYDLTGQGGSDRLGDPWMQHVDSFDLYVEDARAFLEEIVECHTAGRLILGGYSTGGHVALRLLEEKQEHFQAAFVISPLLALKIALPHRALSTLFWSTSWLFDLATYAPAAGEMDPIFSMPFEGNPYTSDPAGFQEIVDLCLTYRHLTMGGVSLGWIKAASDSLDRLWKAPPLHIPVLLATGEADGIVEVAYNGQYAARHPLMTHRSYPEGRHELFREKPLIRAQWWSDFDHFQDLLRAERN